MSSSWFAFQIRARSVLVSVDRRGELLLDDVRLGREVRSRDDLETPAAMRVMMTAEANEFGNQVNFVILYFFFLFVILLGRAKREP